MDVPRAGLAGLARRLFLLLAIYSFSIASLHSSRTPLTTSLNIKPLHMIDSSPRGAYIHIPFCRRRCFYCDFPVQIVGDKVNGSIYESYIDMLTQDIRQTTQTCTYSQPLESIYFGGGTPSLLPPDQLERVLHTMRSCIGIHADCEITIEIDPGTFDKDRLDAWCRIGFNRFSLGVQSFDAAVLLKCGRAHTVADIATSLSLLTDADSHINFSVDLISSLPYLTLDTWRHSLESAASSGASHVSVYDLQIEEKTAFWRWYKDSPGVFPLPSEDVSVDMYKLASRVLTSAGFEHYEVSNYAKPSKRSRHNQMVRCLSFSYYLTTCTSHDSE